MSQEARNSCESNGWLLIKICDQDDIGRFDCRDSDLNEYFKRDGIPEFYMKNDFQFFYDKDKNRNTRAMFFDLKRSIITEEGVDS